MFGDAIEGAFNDAFDFISDVLDVNENATKGLTDSGKKLYDTLDKTIHNSYVESGWVEKDKKTPNIKNIVTQTPELIILIKKKMFSSLRTDYLPDIMDKDERLFITASKQLFENKCKQIEAYEKLTKAAHIVNTTGILNQGMASFIIDAVDSADQSLMNPDFLLGDTSNFMDNMASGIYKNYRNVMNKIRDLLHHNGYSTTTKWISGSKTSGASFIGKGTGVIELTLVTTFSCTNSIKFGAGGANFSVIDPHRLFSIDEQDIEKALMQASDRKFNMMGGYATTLQKDVDNFVSDINNVRKKRGASTISVQLNPFANLYNRIIITMDKYGIELTDNDGNGLRSDLFSGSNADAKTALKTLVRKVSYADRNFKVDTIGDIEVNDFNLADIEIFDSTRSMSSQGGSFSGTERDIMKKIYENSATIAQIRTTEFSDFVQYNEDSNYVRRMLRLNFLGKQIIQPMDVVTAYINSNTIDDNAALAGLKTMFYNDGVVGGALGSALGTAGSIVGGSINAIGSVVGGLADAALGGNETIPGSLLGIAGDTITNTGGLITSGATTAKEQLNLQSLDFRNVPLMSGGGGDPLGQLNKNIGDLKELWGGVMGTNRSNSALEAEKTLLAGPDFPMYLYLSLRSFFGATDHGACVFNGVVQKASESYANGAHTLSVDCKDNSFYFSQVFFQDKPAIYQFNGHLYDPLTPFDLEFDEANGQVEQSSFKLLDENIGLIKSGALKYKYGRFVNRNITENNLQETDFDEVENESDPYKDQANYTFLDNSNNFASSFDLARRVFYNPDGFVYKWKKGIGTAWINNSKRGAGARLIEDMAGNQSAQIITADPFAGQDIVNVISLLTTGEPYNFSTFVDSAMRSGILSNINTNNPTDYFDNISKLVRKQNKVWGDFIPFKKFNVDPSVFAYLFSAKLTLKSQSKKIQQLQNKKAQLIGKITELDASFTNPTNMMQLNTIKYNKKRDIDEQLINEKRVVTISNSLVAALVKQVLDIDGKINIAEAKIQDAVSDDYSNKGVRIVGTEDFFTGAYDGSGGVEDSRDSAGSDRRRLSQKQNFITQRRLWQVKTNTDKNLFIVCDEYDQDIDIQAVAQNLGDGFQMVNTDWQNIGEKMNALARVMGMEFFANSQGHIELRLPQYNRVPSSTYYNMIKRKKKYGIQMYPTFLEKTFTKRLNNVFQEIEELEDWIRLYTSLFGARTDKQRTNFLSAGLVDETSKVKEGKDFIFITLEETGTLASMQSAVAQINKDYTGLYEQEDDLLIGQTGLFGFDASVADTGDFFERNTNLDFIEKRYNYFATEAKKTGTTEINERFLESLRLDAASGETQASKFQKIATKTYNNFDIIKQRQNLNKIYDASIPLTLKLIEEVFDGQYIDKIVKRLQRKLGRNLDKKQFVSQHLKNSSMKYISPSDILDIQEKISQKVSLRYRAILSASNLIKNLDQAARANAQDGNTLSSLLLPNLFPGDEIPDYLSHMIEDETEDDYGTGAGKRYVIEPKDILSITYGEKTPEFTSVSVKGAEAGGLVGGQGFNVGNGMEMRTVWAVDYDLWRMYGFKNTSPRFMPFFSNVETQLAPYAIYLLNQQRAGLLHAGLTRTGNEFSQPGEVYHVKDRDLLFYAEDVKHQFTYGGNYTTTMSLTFGHTVGEYIPTPLDVIGKSIYRGHHTNVGNYRMSHPANFNVHPQFEAPLGSIIFSTVPADIAIDDNHAKKILFDGDIGQRNIDTLTDILYKLRYALKNTILSGGDNRFATVSVRIYRNNDSEPALNTSLFKAAISVIEYLKNPTIFARGEAQGAGKTQEDSLPITRVSPSQILGGFEGTQVIGIPRIVNLKENINQQVSVNKDEIVRTPSSSAFRLAREFIKSGSGLFESIEQLFDGSDVEDNSEKVSKSLRTNVIDIWLEYIIPDEQLKSQIENANQSNDETQKVENFSDIENFYRILSEHTGSQTDSTITIEESDNGEG